MDSTAVSSLRLSYSPFDSITNENLSLNDRASARLSTSPKGLRLALSPLSLRTSSSGNMSNVHRNSPSSSSFLRHSNSSPRVIKARSIFSPTRRRRRDDSAVAMQRFSSSEYDSDENDSSIVKKKRREGRWQNYTPTQFSSSRGQSNDMEDNSVRDVNPCWKLLRQVHTVSPSSVVFDFTYDVNHASGPSDRLIEQAYMISATVQDENMNIETEHDEKQMSQALTHQQQLRVNGCPLLSFEDVILPSIVLHQQKILRKLQAKAQGYKDVSAVQAFQLGRLALTACGRDAQYAIRQVRLMQKEKEEKERILQKKLEDEKKEQERLDKIQRHEQRLRERAEAKSLLAMQRKNEAEKRRRDKRKNWPKNKELWREVALLMTDLARLEKEEKMWKDASEVLDQMEANLDDRIQKTVKASMAEDCNEILRQQITIVEKDGTLEKAMNIDPVIDQFALSARRIQNVLGTISSLTIQSDDVRKKLYESYNQQKLKGYFSVKDPKALIRALALP